MLNCSIHAKLLSILEGYSQRTGKIIAWLSLLMVLMMFYNVVSRYLFETSLVWQQELVRFMHAVLFLSAVGYSLKEDQHVRVDIFYQRMNKRQQAWVNLLGCLMLLLPFSIAVVYLSYDFVLDSWAIYEASSEYNGIKGIFLLKTCIWVFAVHLFLQGLAVVLRSMMILKGNAVDDL